MNKTQQLNNLQEKLQSAVKDVESLKKRIEDLENKEN